ncbi:hypothetical protein R1flu_008358 [Riccia fluitans]|uniref:RanBP2-type domain-containing protein n=1 Tax=Riccia fluitans TaxID=41844 RepID=A0ABD1YBG9_9MARC
MTPLVNCQQHSPKKARRDFRRSCGRDRCVIPDDEIFQRGLYSFLTGNIKSWRTAAPCDCPSVYVTKALGDYTRIVTDWENLPDRVGNNTLGEASMWYDNVVEAYFDDEEPYKIIKAMCRLYCSVCENASAEDSCGKGMMKKGYVFKNIDALRRHQFGIHKVFMCELCLEGRKVFMIEQKLYTKSQLDRHNYNGDSQVDGTEEERGGFAGHPECAFCKKRFYGDNELYQHMSQEHYTCHICQRARPGHYEYYRNYDDLEAHFRQEHVLCEHPDCLAKKFVVFPSEAELKRHNATAHGGHMSRSQRNAALQIPVSFQFRRIGQNSADDSGGGYINRRGGRGRGGYPYTGGSRSNTLDASARASVETAQLEEAVRESTTLTLSSERAGAYGVTNNPTGGAERRTSEDLEAGLSEQGDGDGENEPSRYLAAVWGGGPSALGDAAFPPLPGTSRNARRKAKMKEGPATMAALLSGRGSESGGRGGIRVLNVAGQWPASSSSQMRLRVDVERTHQGQSSINRHQGVGTTVNARSETSEAPAVSTGGRPGPPPVAGRIVTGKEISVVRSGVFARGEWATERGPTGAVNLGTSAAARPFRDTVPVDRSNTVTARVSELSLDLRAANKALVERIRAGLKGSEQQYADFRDVSARFRKGEMISREYYDHISRLGLSFLVPELARLCPDPQKGKELMEAHTGGLTNNIVDPRSLPPGLAGVFPTLPSTVPVSDSASSSSNGLSAIYPSEETIVEQLTTDGYRRTKGKAKLEVGSPSVPPPPAPGTEGTLLNELAAARDRNPQVLVRVSSLNIQESSQARTSSSSTSLNPQVPGLVNGSWACGLCTLVNSASAHRCCACDTLQTGPLGKDSVSAGVSSDKRKKKSSKFQRVRLGDGSAVALLDCTLNAWGQASQPEVENRSSGSGFVGGGVWNNGGGQRLVSLVQRETMLDDALTQVKN